MSELRLQRPSPKQAMFLRDKHKHILFGGARGGGKSWCVRDKAKRLSLRYPGIKLLIVRRTYQELENNHIQPLRGELHGIARYVKAERMFYFPNGSTIRFGYCASDGDLDQYQGAEYDVIFLDEATQLREEWIRKIVVCVRGVNDFPKRVYYTCNPGGVSHGYFKRLFIDRKFEPGERPEDYSFIQSLVTDNKALMASQPEYVQQLESLPPKLRDAWLYGRWDIFQGQFFEELRLTPDTELCQKAGITPEEALEEARWCLEFLDGEALDLPVVYDWEYVSPSARTGGVDRETLTECVKTFCAEIEGSGYESMVYFNNHVSRDLLDLEAIAEYPFWLAQYRDQMDYPHRVDLWQYTEEGTVPGIEGDVDIDLMFIYE